MPGKKGFEMSGKAGFRLDSSQPEDDDESVVCLEGGRELQQERDLD